MVGRRGVNAFANGRHQSHHKDDNNSYRPKPAVFRFQDVTNQAMEDQRRKKLKDKLIDAVKGDELERYRKSEDELKHMDNKKVKHFYKQQNQALNDWREVDSVVRSIADDILESFDPDRDHDGLLEHGGALQAQGEDVEAFLPEEEQAVRKKAQRSAKRAINVRIIALSLSTLYSLWNHSPD